MTEYRMKRSICPLQLPCEDIGCVIDGSLKCGRVLLKKTQLPPPETCGRWLKDETGMYTYDWECSEVQSRVTDTINFLTKGCSCKKGCHNNLAISVNVETAVDQDVIVKGVLMLVARVYMYRTF